MKAINKLQSVDEVSSLITKGQVLILAAQENILSELPTGQWIGGTIPYFMDEHGGCFNTDKIFVTDMTEIVKNSKIVVYPENEVTRIPSDRYSHGLSYMLVPGFSGALSKYALEAQSIEGLYDVPLMGWVTGIDLNDVGKVTPKVFNGLNKDKYDNSAVVMHVELPGDKLAALEIINIFKQGEGDTIEFKEEGFSCTNCLVNGKEVNLAEYIEENNIDTRMPLVADYSGAMINISFQQVNKDQKRVLFYAPLRKNVRYKLAAPVENYVNEFLEMIPGSGLSVISSCNCILNYLFSELEGKKTGNITGPFTFGEIAYVLVNQTMVYLSLMDS